MRTLKLESIAVVRLSQYEWDRETLSIADLSPHNADNVQEIIVLFKAYFDGGNDANNAQHRWVTLSAILSDQNSLKRFVNDWRLALRKNSVDHLHTKSAVWNKQH